MKLRIPYVHEDVDRHGNVRVYHKRPGGPRVRIREAIDTPEFWARYRELKAAAAVPPALTMNHPNKPPIPGTFRALCVAYMASGAYRVLDPSTQRARALIIASMLAEPPEPGSAEVMADCPIKSLTRTAVTMLRDRKADLPDAANGRMRALRGVFKWALESEQPGVGVDHARGVAYLSRATLGHHTWTEVEVAQYEARWPTGTRQRLALDVMLYTGFRRSDAVRVGRQHVRQLAVEIDGETITAPWIVITQAKNKRRRPVVLEVPLLPELAASIGATPTGDLAWLATPSGRPYTPDGFGLRFKAWCTAAGLPAHCTAHGLRKAGATIAANRGASEWMLMAVFGWQSPKEAATYTRQVQRRKLAAKGMRLLGRTGT